MIPRRAPYAPIWFCSGLVLLLLTLLRSGGLALGTPIDRLAVGGCLALLALAAFLLLHRDGAAVSPALLFVLAAACYLRLFLLDHQTYDYLDFLSRWAAFFRENGGWAALGESVGDYNAPYLYLLALFSYLDLPDLYLIKLCSIFADVLLAWGGARLVRRLTGADSFRPMLAFCLLLFLPTVVLNGAYWGQCDTIYAALCLHALANALEQRGASSVLLLSLAFSFKLQTIFLIPLWCVLWYAGRVQFRHLLLFPVGFFATLLPALAAGRPLGDLLGIYLNQTGEYSALTLNAPSVFAFLPYGAQVNEALLSKLGIGAAFVLVLALLGFFFPQRAALTDSTLLLLAAALALGVPFFLPHMHERYFMLAEVLTLLLAVWEPKRVLPAALLVQAASLGGYHAYLRLQYAFPMALGSWMNLTALVLLLALLLFPQQVGRRMLSPAAPAGRAEGRSEGRRVLSPNGNRPSTGHRVCTGHSVPSRAAGRRVQRRSPRSHQSGRRLLPKSTPS